MSAPGLVCAVMAGGPGQRLWPLVRRHLPKACASLDGRQTLLGLTIARLRRACPEAAWLIITTRGQERAVAAALPKALRRFVLVEPQVRNTAACLGLAAAVAGRRHPETVVVAAPADHWIGREPAFRRDLRTAIETARASARVVTLGLKPRSAHTGLGYLCGTAGQGRVLRLRRFIEKPSRSRAARLAARRGTYWNSGIFIARADVLLRALGAALPRHAAQLVPLAAGVRWTRAGLKTAPGFAQHLAAAYRRLRAISFDHGVMAGARDGRIVPAGFAWEDLGSWDVWAARAPAARTVAVESPGATVVAPRDHLVAVVGMPNAVVVHTPTATLVCRRDAAQRVREVVAALAAGDGAAWL